MEILLAEKVPIINNYIWEQEKGNMEFVCNGGMGIYKKNPRHLPDLVNKLINHKEYYDLLTTNIRKNMIRNGVEQVSEYIMNFN
jgi:processive 1,2-diacylglycerol beta-glucosyltransferase/1,2-diacylglycerol 3-beta-galactosyltransferase